MMSAIRVDPTRLESSADLGRIRVGFAKIERRHLPVLIVVCTATTWLLGLASFSSFGALARTPGTGGKVGLFTAGVLTGVVAIQSAACLVGSVLMATGAIEVPSVEDRL